MNEKKIKKYQFKKPNIGVNFMNQNDNYKNYKDLKLKIPGNSYVICGCMNSGKTTFGFNFIDKTEAFRRIYILAKDTEDDLTYNKLKSCLRPLEEELGKQILFISDDINKIDIDKKNHNPKAWKFNKHFKNIVIIDDFVDSLTSKELKIIRFLFKMSRHYNITPMFLTQSFYSTDKFIRRCISNVVLCSVPDARDLKLVLRSYNTLPNITADDLFSIYNQLKQRNPFTALHLDLKNPDLTYRIRADLIPVSISRGEGEKTN